MVKGTKQGNRPLRFKARLMNFLTPKRLGEEIKTYARCSASDVLKQLFTSKNRWYWLVDRLSPSKSGKDRIRNISTLQKDIGLGYG